MVQLVFKSLFGYGKQLSKISKSKVCVSITGIAGLRAAQNKNQLVWFTLELELEKRLLLINVILRIKVDLTFRDKQ